ncbi:MAG: glycoside hydrolase family 3 C-terminal domain-containing protein, partial [Parabacteroides sp.]|nr:glycoside hydrolase family 3 C-terminal domain-containing protein [Parabacteroides sp.]
GFKGIVVTDWGSPKETVTRIHAGNDLMMGGEPRQTKEIIEGVQNGTLSMADVDRNVKNVLRYILQTPTFKKYKASLNPDLKAHAKVSRDAAVEGIVLLKNEENALPLVKEDTIALFGVGSYYFYANGLGSADVNKPYVINMIQGLKNAQVNTHPIVNDFYDKYLTAQEIQLKETNIPNWKNWFFGFKRPQEAIVEDFFIAHRAKDCSKAVITISRNAGEALDRENEEGDYLLTRGERELIANVSKIFHAQGKKVIVVLNTGGAMDIASWANDVDGIVMAWQPGQEGGDAVADILTGKVNPSGKLPMTLAIDYYDIPSSKNFPQHWKFSWDELLRPGKEVLAKKDLGYTLYEEDIYVGYRHFNTFNKPVAYPFGYGLSYTTFEYGNAKLKKSKNTCTVTVDVTNTGKVAGKEAVQLYSTAPKGKLEKPLRELKAFAKTKLLQPGETTTVSMTFSIPDLASFDESIMSWVTDAGDYTLSIGASVEDIKATLPLNVKKSIVRKAPTKIIH